MGKSAVKGLLRWMPVGATWMLAAVTIAASRSGHYHPDSSVVMPLLGLAVPILLVSCLITALCWALARKKWAIVPLAAFFFNWEYLTAVVRFGSTDDDVPATAPAPNREGKSGGCLTVATYNVHHFGNEITGYSCKEIARYMQQRHVDVLCFQEFGDNPHFTTDSLRRALSHWPYALIPADDSIRGILPVAVFSRYPLAGGRFITYPRSSNCSMACDIVLGADTLRLLNNHLQTTSVSQNRRKWERELAALVRNIKRKLTDGDSVKLDGLGVFYTTFHSKGTPSSEECTVKNIDKVNIRFLTDSGLRLVNDSGATTKGSPNNVAFSLYNPKEDGPSGGGGSGSGDDGEEQDPLG